MRTYFDVLLLHQIYEEENIFLSLVVLPYVSIFWYIVVLPNLWENNLICCCSTKSLTIYFDLFLFYKIYEKIFWSVVVLQNLWENIFICCSSIKSMRKYFVLLFYQIYTKTFWILDELYALTCWSLHNFLTIYYSAPTMSMTD